MNVNHSRTIDISEKRWVTRVTGTHFSTLTLPAGHIESHLRYPHCWVWLTASQLFGQLFAAQQPEKLLTVWRAGGDKAAAQPAATAFIATNLDKKV